jgi:hypothetical protein
MFDFTNKFIVVFQEGRIFLGANFGGGRTYEKFVLRYRLKFLRQRLCLSLIGPEIEKG